MNAGAGVGVLFCRAVKLESKLRLRRRHFFVDMISSFDPVREAAGSRRVLRRANGRWPRDKHAFPPGRLKQKRRLFGIETAGVSFGKETCEMSRARLKDT